MWDQLQQFQQDMNRLFDRWGQNGARMLGLGTPAYPPVNLQEDNDTVFLEAELPGLELKDLEIYVTGGDQLTLKGERKQPTLEKGVWHRREREFGNFVRVVALPYAVDPSKVEARFENGVLQVKLAKHESAKPRKIAVKGE
jgi:HSP20 family protein